MLIELLVILDSHIFNNFSFLAHVLLKARRLEAGEEPLTEDKIQQLSVEIYSCRIISFLMNYAADLMLKSVVADRKMNFSS